MWIDETNFNLFAEELVVALFEEQEKLLKTISRGKYNLHILILYLPFSIYCDAFIRFIFFFMSKYPSDRRHYTFRRCLSRLKEVIFPQSLPENGRRIFSRSELRKETLSKN